MLGHHVSFPWRRTRDSRSRIPAGKGSAYRHPEGSGPLCPRRAGGVSTGSGGWAQDYARAENANTSGDGTEQLAQLDTNADSENIGDRRKLAAFAYLRVGLSAS